ncbi:protein kinase [Micromonospora sp. NPDC092111]|uniref:serine/threonine protein kinase n=1 Tax=Micromonospora sp. NPDC092111 TaxID=3364289 RepID=UPI003814E579
MLNRGVLLSDRYRLGERVATGGMGAVWRGVDTLLDRAVAVKVLLPALVADPEFTTRFQAEARMLAALRHPGVVAVHDVGTAALADGSRVSYLVMEYVDGEPLSARVRRAGPLDPAATMAVVAQAAAALHAAHTAGIVHRDVKPANLLVQPDGTVVLVDFGIARSTATAGITATHMVLGTASYMSPEQAVGLPVSAATDVYALGAVAYFCLAGRPPFVGDNPLQVALRHANDAPPPLPPGTPPAVAAVIARALAKRPADRWPDAAALATAALAAGDAAGPADGTPPAGQPLPPYPAVVGAQQETYQGAGRPDPPVDRRRRRREFAGVAGAVLAVLAAVGAVLAFQPGEPTQRGPELAAESAEAATAPSSPVAGTRSGMPKPGTSASAVRTAAPTPSGGPTTSGTPGAGGQPPGSPATTAAPQPGPTTTSPAKPNPYTARQVCGSGYQVIDSAALTAGGVRQGRVYLLWNETAKANCVVTMKEQATGRRTATTAYLEVQGKTRSTDSGSFEYYAGPVRAGAGGVCVKWGGSTGGASYGSGFSHCG